MCVLFRLDGIDEDMFVNEHAVDDPEEVAKMVEMWVSLLFSVSTLRIVAVKELFLLWS